MIRLTLVPLEDRVCFAAGSTLQVVGAGDGYTLKVNSYGRVAVVEIGAAEYAQWAQGRQSFEVTQAMARRVYRHLPDDYDFLMMVNNDSAGDFGANYSGQYTQVKNDTAGIGAGLSDATAAYGSAGRLQGLIHLTSLGGVSRGPSLHELMHRWGNAIPDWSREDPVHWGFSSVGGQLGGWQAGTLTDLGGGNYQARGPLGNAGFNTFVNGGNSVPYSPLELYLMGLTGPEALTDPLQIARGADFGTQPGDVSQGRFTATGIETRTAADLVAQLGPRTPAVAASQKAFRGLVAVVTAAPVPQAVLDKMDTDVELFGLAGGDGDDSTYNFFEATGGRATLKLDGLPDGLGPRNVPPTAVLDAVTAADAATVAVLANDSDANGDLLTVTAVTQPSHGTATLNADATVTYVPNPGTGGLDSADKFTYTVSDGRGGAVTAEVTINLRSRRVPPPFAPPIPPGVTGYVVHGFAWRDRNSNGTLDAGDALPGARIYNDSNGNDKYDLGEPVAAPDATGFYALGIPLTDSILYTATHPETRPGSSYAFISTNQSGQPEAVRRDWVFDNRWFAAVPPVVPPVVPPAVPPVVPPAVPPAVPPVVPPAAPPVAAYRLAPQFTVGLDRGGDGTVRLQNADQSQRFAVAPFAGSGAAGVRTASADFNGDGVADLVVGTGPGGPTRVRVLDGKTQAELFALDPFEASFVGGVYVAAGDVTGDGRADLVVTPDEGGGPRVRVFSGAGFGQVADFFGIDDPGFRGGARAAVADLSGDGTGDLIVSAGFGGGPRVAGFDGKSMAGGTPFKLFGDFLAFESTLRNGAFVAGGDLDGDGFAELVAGGGPGGGPRVTAFSGKALLGNVRTPVANFFAGDSANRGGVRLAAKDLDGDDRGDLVVGSGPGGGSRVTAYAGKSLAAGGTPPELFAFDAQPGFAGGVFVG